MVNIRVASGQSRLLCPDLLAYPNRPACLCLVPGSQWPRISGGDARHRQTLVYRVAFWRPFFIACCSVDNDTSSVLQRCYNFGFLTTIHLVVLYPGALWLLSQNNPVLVLNPTA